MDDYQQLKAYQRQHRDSWNQGLSLRVHRALSWLERAEAERKRGDTDAEFIFLWIAFNAAYASQYNYDSKQAERSAFEDFFERLVGYDDNKTLYTIIWNEYPGVIRSLMDNEYVYQPFWNCVNESQPDSSWKDSFAKAKSASHHALANQDVVQSLSIVLHRLYTLRNQLIHGGATWNGKLNRQQLKDSTALLGRIVPVVLCLMMEHGHETWGDAVYFVEG
jgi:hypothetical protein